MSIVDKSNSPRAPTGHVIVICSPSPMSVLLSPASLLCAIAEKKVDDNEGFRRSGGNDWRRMPRRVGFIVESNVFIEDGGSSAVDTWSELAVSHRIAASGTDVSIGDDNWPPPWGHLKRGASFVTLPCWPHIENLRGTRR
jgi:hypothetical protein